MKDVTKSYIKIGEECVFEHENGFTNLICTAANAGRFSCIPSCHGCYFYESDIECLNYDGISCSSEGRDDDEYVIFVKKTIVK